MALTPNQAEAAITAELGFRFKARSGSLTVVTLEPDLHITTLTQTDGRWDACYALDRAWDLLIQQKIALSRLKMDFADEWQRPDVLEA